MQSRRSVLRALGVSTVFGASGCLDAISASGEGPKNTSREIIDGFGREVPVPERVERIAPTHCTGHVARRALEDAFDEAYLRVGAGSRIEL